VTPETDDNRCLKETRKTGEEKENCSGSASLRRAGKILARTGRDSIQILDLSEAQERDESKRQTMFISIVTGAYPKTGQNTHPNPPVPGP